MTSPNEEAPYDDALAELRRDLARVERARTHLAEVEDAARRSIVKAMKAGLAEEVHGVRTEVQKHSPFSPPVTRAIAEAGGVPPDPRYVRKAKPKAE